RTPDCQGGQRQRRCASNLVCHVGSLPIRERIGRCLCARQQGGLDDGWDVLWQCCRLHCDSVHRSLETLGASRPVSVLCHSYCPTPSKGIAMRTLFCLLFFTTVALAADIKSLQLATGELLTHPFERGLPLPAESKWTVCQGAGPAFVPAGKQYRMNWSIILKAKGPPARLRDIVRVTVQEVSGTKALQIFDGSPEVTDKGLTIVAPAHIVSPEHYPWLYSSEPTLLIFRVSLFKAAEQDKLLQPVLIGADVKRQLKAGGYLQ